MFASWGLLGCPLRALLGRLGNILGRLEAIRSVLGRSWAVSGPSWTVLVAWGALGTTLARLGAFWPREKARDTTQEVCATPKEIQDVGLLAP